MKKVVFILFMFLAISCSKEDSYSDGEMMGNKISEVIAKNNVDRVEIYDDNIYEHDLSVGSMMFEITGGVLYLNGRWFNLSEVKGFYIWNYDKPNGSKGYGLALFIDKIRY